MASHVRPAESTTSATITQTVDEDVADSTTVVSVAIVYLFYVNFLDIRPKTNKKRSCPCFVCA